MAKPLYKLNYLPLARQDLIELVTYISRELENLAAAEKLALRLTEAAEGLPQFPYANPVYHPIRPLKQEYRTLLVGHYLMFYRVQEEEKQITIVRVLYASRDYGSMLEK